MNAFLLSMQVRRGQIAVLLSVSALMHRPPFSGPRPPLRGARCGGRAHPAVGPTGLAQGRGRGALSDAGALRRRGAGRPGAALCGGAGVRVREEAGAAGMLYNPFPRLFPPLASSSDAALARDPCSKRGAAAKGWECAVSHVPATGGSDGAPAAYPRDLRASAQIIVSWGSGPPGAEALAEACTGRAATTSSDGAAVCRSAGGGGLACRRAVLPTPSPLSAGRSSRCRRPLPATRRCPRTSLSTRTSSRSAAATTRTSTGSRRTRVATWASSPPSSAPSRPPSYTSARPRRSSGDPCTRAPSRSGASTRRASSSAPS